MIPSATISAATLVRSLAVVVLLVVVTPFGGPRGF